MLLMKFSSDDSYDFKDFLYQLGKTELLIFLLEDMTSTKIPLEHFTIAVSNKPIDAGTDNFSLPPCIFLAASKVSFRLCLASV